MYPHPTGEVQGTLARDVELAKAAVLYADHVDLISAQATRFSSSLPCGAAVWRR
jgi:hypothetical protein